MKTHFNFKTFFFGNHKEKSLLRNIGEVFLAVTAALLIRSLLFQPFKIPSESLYPTLLVGDYLAVFTGKYGYSKHSFPYSLPLVSGRVFYTPPKRGDIAVFRYPEGADLPRFQRLINDIKGIFVYSRKIPLDAYWIKRVVGLPGDHIQFKKGILFINGQPALQKPQGVFLEKMPSGRVRQVPQYEETLPGGVTHLILRESPEGVHPTDNTDEYRVPPDHFFMVGDNRNHSNDSRYELGYLHKDYLIGSPQMVLMSIETGILDLWKIWAWPEIVRLKRFFSLIR